MFSSTGLLTSSVDRNGNASTFSTSGPYTFTSTEGSTNQRTATAGLTSGGDINAISQAPSDGSGNRGFSYGYVGSTVPMLHTITNAVGHTTTFTYQGSTDQLASIVTASGQETDFTYDSANRVTQVSQLNPSGAGTSTTRFSYVSATQTLVAGPTTNQAMAVSAVPNTNYTIDASGRVSSATDPDGNVRGASYTPFSAVHTASNASGTTTGTYTSNSGESLNSVASPTSTAGSATYNSTNNPDAPDTTTDSAGNTSNYVYDGAGNMMSSSDAAADMASVGRNSDGTISTSTEPGNGTNSTTYAYWFNGSTPLHQLKSITPPTGTTLGVRNFTYDGFGRLLTATTGAGATVTYSYNNGDQLTGVSYSDGTTAVSYTYNTAGRLYQQTDATGTTTYTYDALGNLLSRSGGSQPTVTYTYDLDGNESSTSDGRGTSYATFDAANQQTSLTTAQGTLLNFGYDTSGRRNDTWFNTDTGNTTWSAHTHVTFDANGSVQEQATYLNNSSTAAYDNVYCRVVTTAGSACAPSSTPANNRSQIQWTENKLTGATTSYSYDAAGRLQTASTPGGTTYSYTYDARGNRLTAVATGTTPSSQTLTYNPANQITTTGYSYDGAGNLTASPALGTASYNAAGQMSADTTPSSGSGTYSYAGADQTELVSQAVPGGSTFSYGYGRASGSGVPILESITSVSGGSTKNGYIDNDAGGTPEVFTSDTGAQNYYVTDGAVGSPIALINTSGTQTAAYSYDPYGTYMTTSSTGSAAGFNPARFAGGIYDRTTGDLHYGQRWYDDSIGRFTQQDSVSHLEDLKQENRYAYAGDDPINNIDPTGKSFLSALGDVVDDVVTDAVTVATDGLACITAASSALEVAAPLITPTFSTGLGGIAVSGAVAVVGCTTGIIAGEDLIKPEGS